MPDDCFSYPTRFTVFDGRRHVLGGSMLAEIDARLRQSWPGSAAGPCHVKRAKFVAKTGCDGVVTVRRGAPVGAFPADAACTATGRFGEADFAAWFVPDPATPATRRAESGHRIDAVAADDTYGGSCRIANDAPEQFLCLLVDANKRVQLAGPPLAGGAPAGRNWVSELVYIEKMTLPAAGFPVATAVEIRNLAHRTAGGRIFTLNRLAFDDAAGLRQTVDMGFSFHQEAPT